MNYETNYNNLMCENKKIFPVPSIIENWIHLNFILMGINYKKLNVNLETILQCSVGVESVGVKM